MGGAKRLSGRVDAPGSKSYTHRAVAAASLYGTETLIENPSNSEANAAMVGACRAMGARAAWEGGGPRPALRVTGFGAGGPDAAGAEVSVGNSGTALRIAVAMAAASRGSATITGDASLRNRPTGQLVRALNDLGADVRGERRPGASGATEEYAPVRAGPGGLRGGRADMPNPKSSQYVTALLMVGSLAESDVEVRTGGPTVSGPYVDVTIDVLGRFGIRAARSGGVYAVRCGQEPRPPARYAVPGDYSQAAFLMAAACLAESDVTVGGLDPGDAQGDRRVVEVLRRMGADARHTGGGAAVRVTGPSDLEGVDEDLADAPDLLPVLAVLGAHARGSTRLHGVPQIREKETDRIAVMERELGRHGIRTESGPDEMTVHGGGAGALGGPHDFSAVGDRGVSDHRIAMALSLFGIAGRGAVVRDAGCVAISYPDYFDHLRLLGAEVGPAPGAARP